MLIGYQKTVRLLSQGPLALLCEILAFASDVYRLGLANNNGILQAKDVHFS